MIEPLPDGRRPRIDATAWVHDAAVVIGEVRLGARVSVWPTAVLRGDDGLLDVGDDSNIQDGAVLHNTGGKSVTVVGPRVTVGHRAILHGCRIGADCIIGMGAIVMDNAVVGEGSIVGAGALITMNTEIPPNSLVLGSPGRRVRAITDADREWIEHSSAHYVESGQAYASRDRAARSRDPSV